VQTPRLCLNKHLLAAESLISDSVKAFGRIDIVVNNATTSRVTGRSSRSVSRPPLAAATIYAAFSGHFVRFAG